MVEVDGSIDRLTYCANFPWLFFAGGEKLSEFSLKEMCEVLHYIELRSGSLVKKRGEICGHQEGSFLILSNVY